MRFDSPRTILHGAGVRHEIAAQAKAWQAKRVLIVTDPFLESSGLLSPLLEKMRSADLPAKVFSGVQADPTDENVEAGRQALCEFGADAIVAFGGGSSIDCAKAIRMLEGDPPLIAVPTTAGTGSEATPVMVITDNVAGVKKMTRDSKLMPDVAVVDYELTITMPAALTAHVGIDTLTHGLEAFVSRRRHAMSNTMAESCMERCFRYLRRVWAHPHDREAREGMSLAALEGGLAFGNSSVALVHGMSRPLGALFHIPHGLSNAVLLPEVTRFSFAGRPDLYGQVAQMIGIEPTVNSLTEWLTMLNHDLKVPRLRDCCQNDEVRFRSLLPKMAHDALASGSPGNNPIVPTAEQIEAIYLAAW